MAQFADWWSSSTTTPAAIAAAAARAGMLIESGDDYTVGSFDFGDGGPPAGIFAPGAVCAAHGTSWLVYPSGSPTRGWLAQQIQRQSNKVHCAGKVRQLGTELSAEQILDALLISESTDLADAAA